MKCGDATGVRPCVAGLRRWIKLGLTLLVPYLVSTFSSVGALLRR